MEDYRKLKKESKEVLKKIIASTIVLTNLFWSIPIASFALDEEDTSDKTVEAIVPATANALISKYISMNTSSNASKDSSSKEVVDTNTYSESGDGYSCLTEVNGRKYKNYGQGRGTYRTQKYWDGNIGSDGCGPTSVAIIASGYGINKNPGDMAKIITDKYGDYTSPRILGKLLDYINIKNTVCYGDSDETKIEKIRNNLKKGNPVAVVVNAGPDSKYCPGEHWMVILAIDDKDNITISNPNETKGAKRATDLAAGEWGDAEPTTANLEEFVKNYATGKDYILITQDSKSPKSTTSNNTNTKNNTSSSKTSSTSNGTSKAKTEKVNISNGGYEAIFTSGTTGRQFKEFKQNSSQYNYPSIGYNCDWGEECSTVSTLIIGSGYKNLKFQDAADELNKNSGSTNFSVFLKDFTGQDSPCSSISSVNDLANALSNGSVAIIHDYGYSDLGHYVSILDISSDKSKVYISNPDVWTGKDGLKEGWNDINFVYNVMEKNEVYFVTNDGSTVDYSGDGASTSSDSTSSSTVTVSNHITRNNRGGYKIDINLDNVVDKLIESIEKNTKFRFQKYISSKNQKEYLSNFIKAAIVTQYPDLRTASEIANDKEEIPAGEIQGCIKIKRYIDEETNTSFVKTSLTNPVDSQDNGMYLSYMIYDDFNKLIANNDISAMKYFTIDSSNNIVVAGWETMDVMVDGPNQTNTSEVGKCDTSLYDVSYTPKNESYKKLTTESINYLNQVSNYIVPFNLLWTLLVYSNDEDFANEVANLVVNSDIVLGCYDATQTVVNTYTNTFNKEGVAELNTYKNSSPEEGGSVDTRKVSVVYKFEVTETNTLKTDTPNLKLKHADLWTAVYDIDYKVSYNTTKTNNKDNPTTSEDENVSENLYKYKGDTKQDDSIQDKNLSAKVDEEVKAMSDEVLKEMQKQVDNNNNKYSYRYEIIKNLIDERYSKRKDQISIYEFFKIKEVENVLINLILNQNSDEYIFNYAFSETNDVMISYAKKINDNYSTNLVKTAAIEAREIVSQNDENSDLYNKLTKNKKEMEKNETVSGVSSTIVNYSRNTTNKQEIVETEKTSSSVDEKVTSKSKVRIKQNVKSDEDSFVKLLYNNEEANTNLYVMSYWFFDSIESTAKTADFGDLLRFLFQKVYNRKYGASENMKDYKNLFDPEKVLNLKKKTTVKLTGGSVEEQVWNYLRGLGFSEESTAGIMGNFCQESSMDPSNDGGAAAGICMFEKATGCFSEYQAYANSKGKQWTDLQTQLDYMMKLLPSTFNTYTGREPYYYDTGEWCWWPEEMTLDEFKTISDVNKATEIYERVYERASLPMMEQRKSYAQNYYSLYHGK